METKTVTFICEGKYQFTVKESFFNRGVYYHESEDRLKHQDEVIKTLTEESCYNLMTKQNLSSYLHCTNGPAIVYLETNNVAYYHDGKLLDKNVAEKLHYNSEFSDYIMKDLGL